MNFGYLPCNFSHPRGPGGWLVGVGRRRRTRRTRRRRSRRSLDLTLNTWKNILMDHLMYSEVRLLGV
jgi:predicted RNA polymerase sigma factor